MTATWVKKPNEGKIGGETSRIKEETEETEQKRLSLEKRLRPKNKMEMAFEAPPPSKAETTTE